jgi:GNAT superfamily N-acetyltransferase
MNRNARIFCLEADLANEPLLQAVERLYLTTQQPDERIPWGWIARSLKARASWRPGLPGYHLLTAHPEGSAGDPESLAGFAYASLIPGFGGYISYLGVAEAFRRHGVATRLMKQMFKVLDSSAGAIDEPLPFVVWESHPPSGNASPAELKNWEARVQLFDRVGAYWVDSLPIDTPNYADEAGEPVRLELFVRPMDRSREGFTSDALRELALGLLKRVYRLGAEDPLIRQTLMRTLPPARPPRLRPAREASRKAPLASVATPAS